ncbi:hypothetical protein B0H14DRAFT_2622160 [Mycena olivaceomarginata]|nr:hypothetical protein B0H14DRAFT_2622160 [Mycena olivaceomarginata]
MSGKSRCIWTREILRSTAMIGLCLLYSYGLHHDVKLLPRNKFNPVKCDFYPAHHILEDRFQALMLDDSLRGIVHPPKTALIDGLELYFSAKSNGPFKDITFEELDEFSHVVYRRYMCNDAYDDAQGDFPRNPKIHGPPTVPNAVPGPEPVVSDDEEEDSDPEDEPVATTSNLSRQKKGKGSRSQ